MNSFTLEEVKKIAISFNRVFGTSTIVSGPKTTTYKLSLTAFALTLILMLVAILTPAASSAFVLASNFTAAAFECIGIYLYAGRYERQYRDYMLRRSGVLSHEGRYEPSKLNLYKTLWLKKHFKVDQASYLEIVENLDKVISISRRFQNDSISKGEKIIDDLFSMRPYRSLFTLPFLGIALNLLYKLMEVNESLKTQVKLHLNDLPGYGLAALVVMVGLSMLVGLFALGWRLLRDLYLERRKGKCSRNSLNVFVQALLERAPLPIHETRAAAVSAQAREPVA
ncbi:hypothetical protein IAE35_12135 [Pseudomonas sp. S75]|uniref:hypothetical protein n=1 Tax=unclassified Pseudomonas TaxID=196821 RepID=UPI001903630C|nr:MULTISPECIES: hypothetical protein [unclassified Pseudomonas]MBJ9977085.1 hypothetical protein [Pseudomonas sp. S30]MBK0154087.1 hypothetical protein [Pseudomonas sp. S75]